MLRRGDPVADGGEPLLQAGLADHEGHELVDRGDHGGVDLDGLFGGGGAVLVALGLEHEGGEALGVGRRGAVVDGERVEHEALAEAGDAEAALDPRVLALDLGDALVERGGPGLELGAVAEVEGEGLALPGQHVQVRRGVRRCQQRAQHLGLVDDAVAVADREHGEQLARRLRDRHARLDAGAAPLAEHDEAGPEAVEVRGVLVHPRREALVVGLRGEHRRAALGRELVLADQHGAVGAVQLDLGPVAHHREGLAAFLVEEGEHANHVVEQLDARPGNMRQLVTHGGHGRGRFSFRGNHGRSLRLFVLRIYRTPPAQRAPDK